MTKLNLPNNSLTNDNYTSEANYLKTLYDTKPRSSTGQSSFTSSTSGVVYTTTGTLYDSQGQEGLLQILQLALASYGISATDYNGLVDGISQVNSNLNNHSNNTTNPHSVTTTQIGAIPTSEKGMANGIATLDNNGILFEKSCISGIYTGNSITSQVVGVAYSQDINLGFQPSVVIVAYNGANPFSLDDGQVQTWGGVALVNYPQTYYTGDEVLAITPTGFRATSKVTSLVNSWNYGPRANQNGSIYRYIVYK